MHLLQIDFSGRSFLFVVLIAFLVQCFILYVIIQRAAASANEKVYRQAFIHNQLLVEQLLANGVSQERVMELADQMEEPVKDTSRMEAFDKSLSRVLLAILLVIGLAAVIMFLTNS
jgi:hypothetical protein